jgi:DNA polymerase (family 10)
MKYGVGTAQRGWLTADDVINAWPLERLLTFLRKASSSLGYQRVAPLGY